MSEHYKDYIVNTDDVEGTKQVIRDNLNQAAGVLLAASTHHHGKTSTEHVTFVPTEIETGFVFSKGTIVPQNTEASIKAEDDGSGNYLILITDLNPEDAVQTESSDA